MRGKKKDIPVPAPAPLARRGFAFLLDWYAGSAFSAIPVGILWNMLTGKTEINTDLSVFESPYGWLAGALGLLFGAIYYYVIPLAGWKGQTPGKRLLGIRIVGDDYEPLPAGRLAVRQIAGVMVLEGAFMLTGQYAVWMLSAITFGTARRIINYLLFGAFFISAWLVFKQGKAAHDLWAHSRVVMCRSNE